MNSLPLTITGRVRHGKALGRTIGMPTVNLIPDSITDRAFLSLPFGVYFSEITADGTVYRGVTNIGIRPTVTAGREDTPSVTVETYIFDFSGDLYDREISVKLIEFHRPEMRFGSVDELSAQMYRDMEDGRRFFSEKDGSGAKK